MKKTSSHGGKRPGSGRKKKEPTITIRVPVSKLQQIKEFIKADNQILDTTDLIKLP